MCEFPFLGINKQDNKKTEYKSQMQTDTTKKMAMPFLLYCVWVGFRKGC